jgi:hypothetical protein
MRLECRTSSAPKRMDAEARTEVSIPYEELRGTRANLRQKDSGFFMRHRSKVAEPCFTTYVLLIHRDAKLSQRRNRDATNNG